jgi:hypothetical protein
MQNIANIVSSLPLRVDDLCDTIKIIFIGAHKPDRKKLRKVCGVRKQYVRNALLWLKEHNYLYQTIPSKAEHIIFFFVTYRICLVDETNKKQFT